MKVALHTYRGKTLSAREQSSRAKSSICVVWVPRSVSDTTAEHHADSRGWSENAGLEIRKLELVDSLTGHVL